VRGGVRVRRVLIERGRAVGVETGAGVVGATEVVLSAGAVGSAYLLLRSGLGPAADLRAAGIPVLADLPVGRAFTDHPLVYLPWRPARPLPAAPGALPLRGALHTADLELLPWWAPFGRVMGTDHDDGELAVGIGLLQEESRGRLGLDGRGAPRVEYRYLTEAGDRHRLRSGVRLAVELLRTPPLTGLVAATSGPGDDVLADDRALDLWIRAHLTTAVHLSGTARMGPDGDPAAVVDQHLRVRGVDGLRVVDTSVLPRVTSRGPAATAVMIGERAADLMTGA
jgi:choline dehydrogenase-like flavoprotein